MSQKKEFALILVDDERTVLESLQPDIQKYTGNSLLIETCESAQEAWEVMEDLQNSGISILCIISDYYMPSMNGVDFLIRANQDSRFGITRKILLSGQAKYENVIQGINQSAIHRCLTKPWDVKELLANVEEVVTDYFLSFAPDQIIVYQKLIKTEKLTHAFVDSRNEQEVLHRKIEQMQESFLDQTNASDETLFHQLFQEIEKFTQESGEAIVFQFKAGTLIIEENQPNAYLWLMTQGELELTKQGDDGREHKVSVARRGSLLGLISFISGEPAFTHCRALTDIEVMRLSRDVLEKIMKNDPVFLTLFANTLLRSLTERIKNSTEVQLRLEETLLKLDAAHIQLVDAEKMATLGQLVAGIAHELNNPVAAILRGTEYLKDKIPQLLNSESGKEVDALGGGLLLTALTMSPLSTSEIRKRTKDAQEFYPSMNIARKAVQLGLDTKDQFKRYFKGYKNDQLENIISDLDTYYQAGSFLRNIEVCSTRIAALVRGLKNYARLDTDTVTTVDLHEGIEDTLMIFSSKLKNFEVIKEYQTLPPVECYASQLNQVWTNLISNSIGAMGESGRITIQTGMTDDGSKIRVIFEDNGPGIPPELIEKIFELNFTTKRGSNFGLGMGLAICRQIVTRHGGTLTAESKPGEWTRFTMTLATTFSHNSV
ncbi:MAG: cyclic nucleotide-binding domain-containing protein [SAR324 cluster bacterium]|nr:cyclic nucleotide-binding domain-containing protein [SAR324 cluster bacterium]